MQNGLDKYIQIPLTEGPVKLIKMQAMHGANYFSAGPVIYMRIDLGDYDEVFSNDIPGLYDMLLNKIPSLYQHYCSPGVPGGFLKRVKEGTLIGHIIEHISIELQTLAGMDVGYGKTRSTLEKGVYNVCFRFFDEVAGTYAGKSALNLINAFLSKNDFNVLEVINNLIDIREKQLLGPSTQAIVDEAEKRKIPHIRLDNYNLVQIGTGKYHKSIRATITSDTNFIAVETADNKYLTNIMLKDAGLPVLRTEICTSLEHTLAFWQKINSAVVVKPAYGYLGKNISLNINSSDLLKKAFDLASTFDEEVLVQEYHTGFSYRLLVINYKLVAASLLTPPFIVGNGQSSIGNLINELNNNPLRKIGDKSKLSKIVIDDITKDILVKNGVTLESILPNGEQLFLKYSGNMRLGGSSTDVTDLVHPFNIFIAERAAKVIGLNVAGIDILCADISIPLTDNNGVILEVNSAPDFRMHLQPTFNKARPVAKYLLDMLFPLQEPSRVPIISITGSVGKTLTAFFLNYCLSQEGYTVGLTTTEGLYINNQKLMGGDMTFPEHVALVLKDPTIDCAILETSLEGILRMGLGYKFADFGIVLNIQNEHLGNDDMEFIEDIAYAKSVVAEEVFTTGYTILNADDPHLADVVERLYSKPVFFSQAQIKNPVLINHIKFGGLAVCLEQNTIKVYHKHNTYEIISFSDIPFTQNGKASFLAQTILSSIAMLTAFGMHPDNIKKHLLSFKTNYNNAQGRFNIYNSTDFQLLIDYAHNVVSFKAIADFLQNFNTTKIGFLDATGNRSDEEIMQIGSCAATMFNHIYIYEGKDTRGRENGVISQLLHTGVLQNNFNAQNLHLLANHQVALEKALSLCNSNNFVCFFTAESTSAYKFFHSIIS